MAKKLPRRVATAWRTTGPNRWGPRETRNQQATARPNIWHAKKFTYKRVKVGGEEAEIETETTLLNECANSIV